MIDRNIVTEREAAFRRAVQGGGAKSEADKYLERLIKLIPAEVLVAFTATESIVATWHSSPAWYRIAAWGCFAVILLALPSYLKSVARISKMRQIAASTLAYLIWAAGSAGPPFDFGPEPRALILALGSLLLPLVRLDRKTG